MNSLWPSTRSALDESLSLLYESVGKLQAAQAVEIPEVIEQIKTAAEAARNLRALVWAEMPEASWQTRKELDALIDETIKKQIEAKALDQLRSRLLAIANELEQGSIVHRRALRASQLDELRLRAINELRAQAGMRGAPQTLPGPEADLWIEWACALQEPADAESLKTLRNGFAHLDEFIANLEPNMWVAKKETPA